MSARATTRTASRSARTAPAARKRAAAPAPIEAPSAPASAVAAPEPAPARERKRGKRKEKPDGKSIAGAVKKGTDDTPSAAAPGSDRSKDPSPALGRKKLIRDSFTMPAADYDLIAALKARSVAAGVAVKKSELLRAGLQVLSRMPAAELTTLVGALPKIKTGRPGKKKK